jgi:hypothetical protein
MVQDNEIHRITRERQFVGIAYGDSLRQVWTKIRGGEYLLGEIAGTGQWQAVTEPHLKLPGTRQRLHKLVDALPLIRQQSTPQGCLEPVLKTPVSLPVTDLALLLHAVLIRCGYHHYGDPSANMRL